jgi:hypothetical protein
LDLTGLFYHIYILYFIQSLQVSTQAEINKIGGIKRLCGRTEEGKPAARRRSATAMKYVSGPYFEPDFDPLLDRFGTPGYASAAGLLFDSSSLLNAGRLLTSSAWLQGRRRQ